MNVKNFGALGDGKTNDSNAFQRAITYCTANAVSLYIPSGKYYINKPLKGFNYLTIYGEGRSSQILLDLNDGQYCFDAYSPNSDSGWTYSLIIEKLAFNIFKSTSSKKVGAIRISNSMRGCTIRDIYTDNILYPFYFGPNIGGNFNIENVCSYLIDSTNPAQLLTPNVLPALYCKGNTIRISNVDIIGGFARRVVYDGGVSFSLRDSNISGSDLTFHMKRPITINNADCVSIDTLYIEAPDPKECEGNQVNGIAPMITVTNSTKVLINNINLGQGSLYFDNSKGFISNINYGQYAGGLRLLNNSKINSDSTSIGFWDRNLDYKYNNGNVILIDMSNPAINLSINPYLLSTKPLDFTYEYVTPSDDTSDYITGQRSIKYEVSSTAKYGGLLQINLNNEKANQVYTVKAKVKKDINISSLLFTNKGNQAAPQHNYPYTHTELTNQWYEISYVITTNQANAHILLQAFVNQVASTGYFWLDSIEIYCGYVNNY